MHPEVLSHPRNPSEEAAVAVADAVRPVASEETDIALLSQEAAVAVAESPEVPEVQVVVDMDPERGPSRRGASGTVQEAEVPPIGRGPPTLRRISSVVQAEGPADSEPSSWPETPSRTPRR